MRLDLKLDSDRVAPGEQIAGRVVVVEGGPARSLAVTLGLHERTPWYAAPLDSATSVLHEGDLATGQSLDFTVTLPADAPPSVKGKHSQLLWELNVMCDRPGIDVHVARQIEVVVGEPANAATFACSVCGREAGRLSVSDSELHRTSFTSSLTQPIPTGAVERLRTALATGDAEALFELDPEYAPFYCPTCRASYCGEHWQRRDVFDDDGWHDSVRGTCPRGHARMLED